MPTNEENILALAALEIESLSHSEFQEKLIALSENRLDSIEIEALRKQTESTPELKQLLDIYKPVSQSHQNQIEESIVNCYFSNDNIEAELSEPKKTDKSQLQRDLRQQEKALKRHTPLNLSSIFKLLFQPIPKAIAATALLLALTLLSWEYQRDEAQIPQYAMLVSGFNSQYRNIEEKSIVEISQRVAVEEIKTEPVEIYPQNKITIFLRPELAVAQELHVTTFMFLNDSLVEIKSQVDSSSTGAFRVTPDLSKAFLSNKQSDSWLIAIIHKPGRLPDDSKVKHLAERGESQYHTPNWTLLSQAVMLKSQ